MNLLSKISKNSKLLVLADQGVFSGSNFVTTILFARILSPDDFGVFTSIVLYNYLLISISNSIVIQPLQVIIAKIESKASYLSFTFYSQLLIVLLVSIFTYVFLQFEVEFIKGLKDHAASIILYTSGFLFHDYHRKLFLARGSLFHALIIDSVLGIIQVGTFSAAYLWLDFGFAQVVSGVALSYLPSLVLSITMLKPSIKGVSNWKGFLQQHIMQGKWLLMTSVLQWWANNLFMVAAGIFLGARALGALRLVQSFFGVLNVLFQTFENYALPQAALLFQSSMEESKLYLRQISIKGSIVVGTVLFVVFIFSHEIITLGGGAEYAEFSYLVKGMALLYFVIFAGYPTRMAIRMMVLNRFFFLGYVISFLFSLISIKYLLGQWHLMGAIIGLIANQLIMLSYWQYALLKKEFILWK